VIVLKKRTAASVNCCDWQRLTALWLHQQATREVAAASPEWLFKWQMYGCTQPVLAVVSATESQHATDVMNYCDRRHLITVGSCFKG